MGPAALMRSRQTPASLGVHGPGESTMAFGFLAITSATVILSLRTTTLSAPSSREKLLALRNIAGLTGVPQTAIAPLLDDPAPPVRAAAIEAIGQFGNGAIGQLRPLLVDTDAYVRAIAAVTLGRLKDPEAVAMLGQMLQSPVNDTAAMAASVLRDQGADVSAVARRVLVDPNPLTRLSAVPLLAGTGDPAADAALQRALADANPVVRARAAEIVGDSTGPDLPRLRRLLRDGIAEVRMGAAVAVARMAGPH